jgi:hypothetical protein
MIHEKFRHILVPRMCRVLNDFRSTFVGGQVVMTRGVADLLQTLSHYRFNREPAKSV